jgi:hypothetical protein
MRPGTNMPDDLFVPGRAVLSCRLGGPGPTRRPVFRAGPARRRRRLDGPRPGTALSSAAWRRRPRHRWRVEAGVAGAPAPHNASRRDQYSNPRGASGQGRRSSIPVAVRGAEPRRSAVGAGDVWRRRPVARGVVEAEAGARDLQEAASQGCWRDLQGAAR